jgi:hypothetical protein
MMRFGGWEIRKKPEGMTDRPTILQRAQPVKGYVRRRALYRAYSG